ncbi:hypothetical protein [Luteimonas wenzhouensis]|jgi:hypothetical protein|uniref:Lipocalin-like domain-containing protein n=1 Tax=Luteimonas wenzhouensis TaxID=2599615 RepID=A0A5C5TY98_9GAMM|nr:hypothetical protein [Luteimonas wenzhouensis]NLW96056.1 hypothetical protein [Xanthomonadaceae bacterium]TWT18302.1 hypothetical protein FQY79_10450 [Luteimonas wenzhouensis]
MQRRTGMLGLVLVLAAGACAGPAAGRDACLVGRWKPVGNGAAEWIARQGSGLRVAVHNQVASMRLDADGRYWAGSTIDASSSLGGRSARGTATHAASGTWTSANGTLVLQPSQADSGGSVEVRAGDGRATRMPIPAQGGGALAQEYRCSGDTLETRIRIPGSNDPIVQRFVRE